MTPSEIIQRIHEEAKRPEVHASPRLYRTAVARDHAWKKLSAPARKLVLDLAEGDFGMIDLALKDVKEMNL